MSTINIHLLEKVLNDDKQTEIIIDSIKIKDKNNQKCNLSKIKKILGEDFKYNWIFEENENETKSNVFCFEFVNKSKITNSSKSIFINQKIEKLINNDFFEVEDLKISGKGRFIVIRIKTIEEYENEKKLLEKEYINKIKLIDKKINTIKNNN